MLSKRIIGALILSDNLCGVIPEKSNEFKNGISAKCISNGNLSAEKKIKPLLPFNTALEIDS